jgi:hypothetical protein
MADNTQLKRVTVRTHSEKDFSLVMEENLLVSALETICDFSETPTSFIEFTSSDKKLTNYMVPISTISRIEWQEY